MDGVRWWSISNPNFNENISKVVVRAVEYLEHRELLARHPMDITFVKIDQFGD